MLAALFSFYFYRSRKRTGVVPESVSPLIGVSRQPELWLASLAAVRFRFVSHCSAGRYSAQVQRSNLSHHKPVGPVRPVTATDGNCYQAQRQSPPPCRCADNPHLYLFHLCAALHATLLPVISFTPTPRELNDSHAEATQNHAHTQCDRLGSVLEGPSRAGSGWLTC